MFKTNSRFTKTISMMLVCMMLITVLQIPVAADPAPIYLEPVEVSEEILSSDAFYLETSNAQIDENANTSYLLKAARGGEGTEAASVRLNIIDITAKYGKDYKIKIYNSSVFGEKVQNTDESKSLLEEILASDGEIEETNYTDGVVSNEDVSLEEINSMYEQDVESINSYVQDILGEEPEFDTETEESPEIAPMAEEEPDVFDSEETMEVVEEEPVEEIFEEEVIEEVEEAEGIYATENITSLKDIKSLATGLESDRQPMDGGNTNAIAAYTEEMLSALSLELESAYLILDFAEGETEKYIEIIPIDNDNGDGDRMFSANLFANSENAQISALSGFTANIVDDEVQEPATVSFAETKFYPEGGFISVVMERSGAINQMVTVNVKTEDDTAVLERDYSQVETSVAFPYGVTKRTLNIPVRSDFVKDSVQFKITMSDPVNCDIGAVATAYGVITEGSESFDIDEDFYLSSEDVQMKLMADATASSIITGNKIDLTKAYSVGAADDGYSRANGEEWELYSDSTWNDVWSWAHWYFQTRYDYSGFQIDWTKSSGKPCYTTTKINYYNHDVEEWQELWSSGSERWDKRTENIFFPAKKIGEINIKQKKTGGWTGKSPTLKIHSIKPILRPFEITLVGSDPLEFLDENGILVPNTQLAALTSANSTLLEGSSNTGTGTVVKFSGDSFTLRATSPYAYISGVKIVHQDSGKSKVIKSGLAEGTTSVSVKMDNSFISNNIDYITFSKNGQNGQKGMFKVQAILDYYDTTVNIHSDYRGTVGIHQNGLFDGNYYIKNVATGTYLRGYGMAEHGEKTDDYKMLWNIKYHPEGGYRTFSLPDGKRIDVLNGDILSALPIYAERVSATQHYIFEEQEDGTYVIFSRATQKGTALQPLEGYNSICQNDYNGSDLQKWILEPVINKEDHITTYTYHKGDTMRFNQMVFAEHETTYTGSRIRLVTKDNSSAVSVDNKRAYDKGTSYCTLLNTYSSIDVYPNFDKKDNHITVRVLAADLSKFDTTRGIFTAPSTTTGGYAEYIVVGDQDFTAAVHYEMSAYPENDGYVPVWQPIHKTTKYSQETFYFEGTDEEEENIIYLTCEKADDMKYVLTGNAYYSEVALTTGAEGKAWMPASGVYAMMGSKHYGISNEEGKFTTVGMYGINGYSVVYKTIASGITEYKTAVLSNERVTTFGDSFVSEDAYEVKVSTVMTSAVDKSVPYVAGFVATNTLGVENGQVYINDNMTVFTITMNNNGVKYTDSDGVERTESVKAVEILVYDGQTNTLKSTIDEVRKVSDSNGVSVWTRSPTFERGKPDEYAASDKVYVRVTTDRYVGNGTTIDAEGNVVESDVLKETVYAPVYTGYTFVEENIQEPVTHDVDIDTNMDFIKLPLIGSMNATFNIKMISFTITELPNGGQRLQVGIIPKTDAMRAKEDQADDGNTYGVKDIKKAFAGIKEFGQKSNDMSSMGMKSWGLLPVFGIYLDFGIKNVYYTQDTSKKLVFIGGGIFMGITGNFRLVQYFIVSFVPFYLGVEGELSLFTNVGLSVVNEDTATSDKLLKESNALGSNFVPDWCVQANGLVAAYAGVGLCGTLGVRGGIQFNAGYIYYPSIKLTYPNYNANGLILTAAIKVWIDALLFSIPIPVVNLFEIRYGYYRDVQQGSSASLFGDTEEVVENRVVLKERNSKNSEWVAGSSMKLMSTFEQQYSEVLMEDGYDRAAPQLTDIGNGRMLLVFLADDENRSDEERTALVYSIYENGSWTEPVTIQNDGTADFDPNVTDAGDKVLIAWTSHPESDDEYDSEERQAEYLRSMEVYTTTFDKDTLELGDVERMTDDDFYDSAPVGLYDDQSGDMMVYYLKSEVDGDFEESVNPVKNGCVVVYMLYDASQDRWARDYYYDNEVESDEAEDVLIDNWGGQRFLSSPIKDFEMNDPLIMDFDAISYNGIGLYTYTVDKDNNMDSDSDRELFVQAYDFAQHKTYVPIRITSDNVSDALPKLVRNGEYTYLFWLQNNADIRYINVTNLIRNGVNADGSIAEDFEISVSAVFFSNTSEGNINPTFGSYEVFVDNENNLFITWLQPVTNEDGTSNQEIFASALIRDKSVAESEDDTVGSSWSDGVRLTYSGLFNDEVAMLADENGNLVTVSNQYNMDLTTEDYEVTDIKLVATHFKTVGSLDVTGVEYSNDIPQAGSDVEVTVAVKNDGLKIAKGYTIEVYENVNGNVGDKLFEKQTDETITPSSTAYIHFDWTMPENYDGIDDMSLYITVNEAETSEITEYASEGIKIQPVYDIVNYQITEENDGFYVDYTVQNTGNIDAVNDDASMVVKHNDIYHTGEIIDSFLTKPVGDLAIGESRTFTEKLVIPDKLFAYGYTQAFMEVRNSKDETISESEVFPIELEYPYNIVLNGDESLEEITLKAGESLELSGAYSPDEFYVGGIVTYSVEDTSVATIQDNKLVGTGGGETILKAIVVPYGGQKTVKVTVEGEKTIDDDDDGSQSMDSDKKGSTSKKGGSPVVGNVVPFDYIALAKFTDVNETDWFYDAVNYATTKGFFKGTTATTFEPYTNVTRGMITTVIGRMEGVPEQYAITGYTDVDGSMYYANHIAWATKVGIVEGHGDGTFGPDDNVTREQMAKIISNYYKYKTGAAAQDMSLDYTDADAISDWAVEFVKLATLYGLLQGNEDGTFAPQNFASRAEVAAVIERLHKKLDNQ